ncbi:hypothetical protein [Cohnella zeiphila]|uniref:Uncharacterized protein n=1 Tax=Cohnella zeiphila TaxID=2761120 RepID=A0A7X0VUK1_9BACL|nr:hypothetical protein [Cohnella zeiphila]MBB6731079.1 hypothetical protein [Cohnella zeiphila]
MDRMAWYRSLFEEAVCKLEPMWEKDDSCTGGSRWRKRNYPFEEQFQLTRLEREVPLAIMYSFLLPEIYLQASIFEELRRYESGFELSYILMDRMLRLVITLPVDELRGTLLGFIHQARAEFMDILDWIVKRANAAPLRVLAAQR